MRRAEAEEAGSSASLPGCSRERSSSVARISSTCPPPAPFPAPPSAPPPGPV